MPSTISRAAPSDENALVLKGPSISAERFPLRAVALYPGDVRLHV
jgi:hypothetical protein